MELIKNIYENPKKYELDLTKARNEIKNGKANLGKMLVKQFNL